MTEDLRRLEISKKNDDLTRGGTFACMRLYCAQNAFRIQPVGGLRHGVHVFSACVMGSRTIKVVPFPISVSKVMAP
jgi:hypothetical protein